MKKKERYFKIKCPIQKKCNCPWNGAEVMLQSSFYMMTARNALNMPKFVRRLRPHMYLFQMELEYFHGNNNKTSNWASGFKACGVVGCTLVSLCSFHVTRISCLQSYPFTTICSGPNPAKGHGYRVTMHAPSLGVFQFGCTALDQGSENKVSFCSSGFWN